MKHSLLIRCPIDTVSGYGEWCRQIVFTIRNSKYYDYFDVRIMPTTFGHSRHIALEEDNQITRVAKELMHRSIFSENPDVYIMFSIPSEFERLGRLINVGVTAACETDRISFDWVNKINNTVDVLFAVSKWTAAMITGTVYTNTKNPNDVVRVRVPVGFWQPAVDTSIFRPGIKCNLDKINDLIKTRKNFIFVGQWLPGDYGKDRKNIGVLIKTFLETFLGFDDVGLILKVQENYGSLMDRNSILRKIDRIKQMVKNPKGLKFPSIYLIHGYLTQHEMSQLYSHPSIIGYVACHHGEGWGIPITEAMACNVPAIMVYWSGNTDFCYDNCFIPLKYELAEIPDDCQWGDIFVKPARWANVYEDSLSSAMMWCYNNPLEAREIGIRGGNAIRKYHSLERLQSQTNSILEWILTALGRFVGKKGTIPFKILT